MSVKITSFEAENVKVCRKKEVPKTFQAKAWTPGEF